MKKSVSPKLNSSSLYRILRQTFPLQNDCYRSDYKSELAELIHFKIKTEKDLKELLKKHKKQILLIDSEPLDENERIYFLAEYGEEFVAERAEKGFWFAFPALLRLALELEFEDDYHKFAAARDRA